jgi:hypothetical protein
MSLFLILSYWEYFTSASLSEYSEGKTCVITLFQFIFLCRSKSHSMRTSESEVMKVKVGFSRGQERSIGNCVTFTVLLVTWRRQSHQFSVIYRDSSGIAKGSRKQRKKYSYISIRTLIWIDHLEEVVFGWRMILKLFLRKQTLTVLMWHIVKLYTQRGHWRVSHLIQDLIN